MTDLTVNEQLFLLSRDPASGRDRTPSGIDTALAGTEAITILDDRVPGEGRPTPAPLQAAFHAGRACSRLPWGVGSMRVIGVPATTLPKVRDSRKHRHFASVTEPLQQL